VKPFSQLIVLYRRRKKHYIKPWPHSVLTEILAQLVLPQLVAFQASNGIMHRAYGSGPCDGWHINCTLTSIPMWRETHCAEKNDRYFDFKHFKLCTYIDTSNFLGVSCVPWPLLNTLSLSH
jgi:hypothetical protein